MLCSNSRVGYSLAPTRVSRSALSWSISVESNPSSWNPVRVSTPDASRPSRAATTPRRYATRSGPVNATAPASSTSFLISPACRTRLHVRPYSRATGRPLSS